MKTIYFFSGLGADQRIFGKLGLPGFEMQFVEWIVPEVKESIASYARRIAARIDDPQPLLAGVSFGGMIALEVAAFMQAGVVFLIYSAKEKGEINPLFKAVIGSGVLGLLPSSWLTRSNILPEYLFGVKGSDEKRLLREIIRDTDPAFLKWALYAMSEWPGCSPPVHVIEIHGTADRMIPFRASVLPENTVAGGGHLMTFSRAEDVSRILLRNLVQ